MSDDDKKKVERDLLDYLEGIEEHAGNIAHHLGEIASWLEQISITFDTVTGTGSNDKQFIRTLDIGRD